MFKKVTLRRKFLKKMSEFLEQRSLLFQKHDIRGNEPLHYSLMEKIVASSFGGTLVSKGSEGIDIIWNRIGLDIKCVTMKKESLSGESSLLQNFKGVGRELDLFFMEKDYGRIVDEFRKELKSKYEQVMHKYNLRSIYHLWFVYEKDHIFYLSFKLDLDQIENISMIKASNSSVFLKGFHTDIQAKIYKAKKRLELRLFKNIEKKLLL